MNWLQRLLRRVFGPDKRYHEQAQEVSNRQLRVERLNKELAIYRRGKHR